jgi:AICAR transformylase/IMP cyclohydrolase PurH
MTAEQVCRLECLKLAVVSADDQRVSPQKIVAAAKAFFEFVSEKHPPVLGVVQPIRGDA